MTKVEACVFGTICLVMGWTFIGLKFPLLSLPFFLGSLAAFVYTTKESI
jgi:hypothetical protein